MAVPEKVLKAGEAADAALEEMNKPVVDPTDLPPGGDGDDTNPPPVVPDDAVKTLEHRLSVVQGMLDTRNKEYREMERTLNADIVERDRQLQQFSARLDELERKPPPAPEPPDFGTILSPEDLSALDTQGLSPEAMTVITKLVHAVSQKTSADATAPLAKTVEQAVQVADQNNKNITQAGVQRFFQALKDSVPDWEDINEDPKWHAWLGERVTGTDYTRQDVVNHAQSQLDPSGIIGLLNDFKAMSTGTATNPPPPPAKKGMDEAVETVVPASTDTTVLNPNTDKIYTKAEINKFYADAAMGKYKADPEEMKQMEADILEACLDGRAES